MEEEYVNEFGLLYRVYHVTSVLLENKISLIQWKLKSGH